MPSRVSHYAPLALALLAGSILYAQVEPSAQGGAATETVDTPSPQATEVPALDGSGTLSLGLLTKPSIVVGGTFSGGYDSDPLNLGKVKGGYTESFSPYITLQSNTGRTQAVLQYYPTFNRASQYARQSMHLGSMQIVRSATPRLKWTLGVLGSYGTDSMRTLESVHATTGSDGTAAFQPDAGKVTNVNSAFDLNYDTSPRSSIAVKITDSYNSTPSLHQKETVLTGSANFSRSVKMNTAVFVYIQDSDYFGALSCTAVGTGAGLVWKASDQVLLSVRGGPQIDTPGCKGQQGFAYNVSITQRLLHNSQFAITADRQPTISYLGAGLWEDDIAGGFERRFLLSNALSFGAGYIHSSTLLNTPSYSGRYFDASYVRQMRGNLSLKGSYRRFTGQSGVVGIDRDVLQVGLSFSPNSRTLFQ